MNARSEADRFAALIRSRMLEGETETVFNRLVSFAADTFDVPMVTINLIAEDRQVIFARKGIEDREMPRSLAFCSHTVAADEPVILLDTHADERWRGSGLHVALPHMRFYAGAPVRFEGHAVGTFCLVDREPRRLFDGADRERLLRYATLVADLMELRCLRLERGAGQARFRSMASASNDSLVIADQTGAILFWNEGSRRIFGHAAEEAATLSVADIMPAFGRNGPDGFEAAMASHQGLAREVEGRARDGASLMLEVSASQWVEGGQIIFGAVIRDVSDRKAAERRLHDLALSDSLTGLPNRTALLDRLAGALDDGSVAVLVVDLDGFKDANDTLGHAAGDAVLRGAARRLLACAGPAGIVARMGGDEFAVVLPGCADPLAATAVAERVVRAMADPFLLDDHALHLGASVGVALAPTHARDVDDLLSSADLALYQAKGEGRHCCRLYTPLLRAAASERQRCAQDLRGAIANDEFVLFYQPQVRLGDGTVTGAEALIRWRHPQHGLLQPGAFLPALEGSRHAAEVGEWVLRTACRQAAAWRAAGMADFRMAVNVFGAQFRDGNLAASVLGILREAGLPPSALELELTENIILTHDEAVITGLRSLQAAGVGIAFDDYGTGYASLSLLKRYPLTRLKIDRTFVREMGDPGNVAIIDAVLLLARGFGLEVTAEGIETREQWRQLQQQGCGNGQGYLIGRPVPAAEFARRFAHPPQALARQA